MKSTSLNVPFLRHSVKLPYVAHRIDLSDVHSLKERGTPRIGDFFLARVTSVGHNKSVRNALNAEIGLYPGDFIIASYGNRYAVSEYEAYVPRAFGPCQLLNAGGVAGQVTSKNSGIESSTELQPIGFLTNAEGKVMNMKDYSLPLKRELGPDHPPVAIVWGTGMDTGKTTTCAYLTHGLALLGKKVGFAKITGTGNPKDLYKQLDAGAISAYDFVDFGYPSTYRVPVNQIGWGFMTVMDALQNDGADVIVVEIADGLLQDETRRLVSSPVIHSACDGALLAANGSHGAINATNLLLRSGYDVLGISGLISKSELACKETQRSTAINRGNIQCFTGQQLMTEASKTIYEHISAVRRMKQTGPAAPAVHNLLENVT